MADRYFPNVMPDFVTESQQEDKETDGDSLMKLLSMPYPLLSKQFQRSGLDLKETDFTLYSGSLGTAFLLFKSYQVTSNRNDLFLCLEIVMACDSASLASKDVTFICGRAAVCALGAVAAKIANDDALQNYYLKEFGKIKLSRDHPDELLYGSSGFLWACFFINRPIGQGTVPNTIIRAVTDDVIKNGRALARKGGSPLMYEWYGERYWGAAHGLAVIMHVLMDVELKPDEVEDSKGTLKYMIKNRFPSGNYPTSEEDGHRDVLVHWCHGAPGIALTLVKAAKVYGEEEFLEAAVDAAEVVWNRGLLKRVGICWDFLPK